MSSAFAHRLTKTQAKKRAYKAFSLYMRTLWTLKGFCLCFTCNKHLVLKGAVGARVQTGHWVEGHKNSTYINPNYVEPQCFYCNIQLGGNQGEFRDRIRKKLGDAAVDQLLFEAQATKEISVSEYLAMETYYKEQLAILTK